MVSDELPGGESYAPPGDANSGPGSKKAGRPAVGDARRVPSRAAGAQSGPRSVGASLRPPPSRARRPGNNGHRGRGPGTERADSRPSRKAASAGLRTFGTPAFCVSTKAARGHRGARSTPGCSTPSNRKTYSPGQVAPPALNVNGMQANRQRSAAVPRPRTEQGEAAQHHRG